MLSSRTDDIEDRVNPLLVAGIGLFLDGSYELAIEKFSHVLLVAPENNFALDYIDKAKEYIQQGFIPAKRLPSEAMVVLNQAATYQLTRQFDRARQKYREVEEFLHQANIIEWGDLRRGLQSLDEIISHEVVLQNTVSLARKGEFEAALELVNSGNVQQTTSYQFAKIIEVMNKTLEVERTLLFPISEDDEETTRKLQAAHKILGECAVILPDNARIKKAHQLFSIKIQYWLDEISLRIEGNHLSSTFSLKSQRILNDSYAQKIIELRKLWPEGSIKIDGLVALINQRVEAIDQSGIHLEKIDAAVNNGNSGEALKQLASLQRLTYAHPNIVLSKEFRAGMTILETKIKTHGPSNDHVWEDCLSSITNISTSVKSNGRSLGHS